MKALLIFLFLIPSLVGIVAIIYGLVTYHRMKNFNDRMEFEYWAEGLDDDFPE